MSTAAPPDRPVAASGHTFPKSARLRQRSEFARVFEHGRRTAAPALTLHWMPASQARLGISVSRKVDPDAVGRNRIKRVLREAFRALRPQLASADYIVVARPPAAELENIVLRNTFAQLLQRAGALPASTPAGTMRAACAPTPPTPSMPDARSG